MRAALILIKMTIQEEVLDKPPSEEGMEKIHKASLEKRLINYILDSIFCGITFMLCVFALAMVDVFETLVGGLIVLLLFLGYPLYYFATETLLSGKSLAKYITGTRAVDLNGIPAGRKEIAIRSLCRMVPFERFSFLFNFERGWHDRWSNTMVIDEKKSTLPVVEEKIQEQTNRYLK
ncbi:MAG: putative RDD family membrane protein YckC [Flavobacteriales bacterium]